ncbi:MAG: sigma factor-like helix-turn-helix DNA-binding protein [Lachnospiraceae bacterium]|nr:sigma factor-like helix-turn-helix DNA-binding protein [Lachnospiraceae bacterium]
MDKIYERSLLYDFYGELLTDHQKQIFEEVVFDDCTLAEVAERHDISRQGIHDMVRRTTKTLERYEQKLGLVRKFLFVRERVNEIMALADDERICRLSKEILEEL